MMATLVAFVFICVVLFIGLRWFERKITFHPDRFSSQDEWSTPSGASDVWFTTADGFRLHGWSFEPQAQSKLATVIYFHGNGGNITNVGWVGENRVSGPVLITHGEPDPVIPTHQSQLLFAAANEPKKLLIFPGTGHNVFGSMGDAYLDIVAQFIRESSARK
ncbi:MAG TPA: alpha/beta hydrolase [Pyrinomonadaceae bacterium]|nr:alpha/beta hydrolase [Pyrinomonadaceae bacterium]